MYLFFVRHFNDIDHITPIAWTLKRAGCPVAVFCMNPRYDIWNDYRIRFLKDLGVRVDYVTRGAERDHGGVYHGLCRSMHRCFAAERTLNSRPSAPHHLLGVLSGALGTLLFKLLRLFYYRTEWAGGILEQLQARAVFFDHIMPTHYVVDVFLKAANQGSIPTFTLPHGVHLYTNEATKPKSKEDRRLQKFNRYDVVVAPNLLRKQSLTRSGVSSDKIAVLGSARYCKEWMNQNWTLLPKRIEREPADSGTLKVVFFPSKPQCNMDVDRMSKTVEMLSGIEGIRLMVKPHTRTSGGRALTAIGPRCDASTILTAELCEWADAVLVVGSSVVTEALMRGKTALYLKYLHSNTTLFEELQACWIIHDESGLQDALSSLQKGLGPRPYSEDNVKRYIEDVVHGGGGDGDVLDRYKRFILTAVAGEPKGAC
jgi:hypothetical protein